MSSIKNTGTLLFLAGIEISLLVDLAEFLYPGYSVSQNYISDLGVGPGPTGAIFTFSLVLFGGLLILSAYFLKKNGGFAHLWTLILISGLGAIGVGLFNENSFMVGNTPVLHMLSALVAFLFGNIGAIYSMRNVRPPFSYFGLLLGALGLVAFGLLLLGRIYQPLFFGLGPGGMERMAFYPPMFWVLGFGAYLMAIGQDERPLSSSGS